MFEIVYFCILDPLKTSVDQPSADQASVDQASADDQKLVAALDEGKCREKVSFMSIILYPGQTLDLYQDNFLSQICTQKM